MEMDWEQRGMSDDGLEQRESSEDRLESEIERSVDGQGTKRKECRWTWNKEKGL